MKDRIADLRHRASRLPRISLTRLPTPLHECRNLSDALGGKVRIFVKRDDLITCAFGGNKVRKLEFSFGRIRQEGYDCVVFGLAGQSNYCRQVAGVCAMMGIPCYLILVKDHKSGEPWQGNLLLSRLYGAHVTLLEPERGAEQPAALSALEEQLRGQGRKPYRIGRQDEVFGSVGYALCLVEILEEMAAAGIIPDRIFLAGGSGTPAGLVLGKRLLGYQGQVVTFGVSYTRTEERVKEIIAGIATDGAALLGYTERFTPDDVVFTQQYVGQGYAIPSPECLDAIALLGRTEAIVAGPVYTGKGFAGLIDWIRTGRIAAGETVVFVHTGGAPELFAYHAEVAGTVGRYARSLPE